MKINLKNEVLRLIIDYYKKYEIDYKPKKNSLNSYILDFINFKSKLIDERPRTVFRSDKFSKIHLPYEYLKSLMVIEEKIKRGDCVTLHQSSNILDPAYNDLLFNDWIIHHFHLSHTKKNSWQKFYDRSDYLLFVGFSQNQAFLIDILPHKEKELFSRQEFLEIMERNWPEVMSKYIVNNEESRFLHNKLTDSEIHRIRKKGYTTATVEVNGKLFMNPGLGIVTSGHNIQSVRKSDDIYRFLYETLEALQINEENILNDLKLTTSIEELEIKIVMMDHYPYFAFFENNSKNYIWKD